MSGMSFGPPPPPGQMYSAPIGLGAAPTAGPGGMNPVTAILKAYQVAAAVVGSFYQAKAAKTQFGMQVDQARTESVLASVNERRAEQQAQWSLLTGQHEVAARTSQFGAMRGEMNTALAKSGVVRGVGSSAEAVATAEYSREVDKTTVMQNAVRAAIASRVTAADFRRQSRMADIQAKLYDAQRRGINPLFQAKMAGINAIVG